MSPSSAHLRIHDTLYNVSATVDLRRYLPEDVAVGFSAGTGELGELNQILSWSFSSTLEPKQQKLPQNNTTLLVSVLVPLLLFLLASAALGLFLWRQHKTRKTRIPGGETSDSDCEAEQRHGRAELERGVSASGPRRYAYRELAAATNNFADDKKLGRGGFGSVYRGKLAVAGEERPVAIKMLSSESSAQGRSSRQR
jgi:hypothetical protein